MFSDPQEIINQLELSSTNTVVDFGTGSGFYAIAAAKTLSAGYTGTGLPGTGKVYAVDVQKDLLERLKSVATKQGVHNIETVWGDVEKLGGTKLRDGLADCAIMANLLFQVPEKAILLQEAKRVLKPRGRLLIVDWASSFGGTGPQASEVVTEVATKELATKAGFTFEKSISAGAHHYGLIFRKP